MAKIKITKDKLLSDEEFTLRLYEFEKFDQRDDTQQQKNEIYFRPDGVTVLLVDENAGKMLFTRQVRLATFLNGNESAELIETCAGTIDKGETPEEATKREAREETGYEISQLQKVLQAYASPGGVTEIVHFFIANYDSDGAKEDGGGADDEAEDIELVEMPIEEVKEKLAKGWFKDMKTILLLKHYFLSH